MEKISLTIILVLLSLFLLSCGSLQRKTCAISKKVNSYNNFICSPSPLSYTKAILECENEKEKNDISISNFALSVIDKSLDNAACIISSISDIGELNKMLIISAEFGALRLVKLLIKKGSLINYQEGDTGKTALFFASLNGYTKVISLLLKNGAEINIKDYDKRTILTYKDDFCSVQTLPNNGKCDRQKTIDFLLKNNAVVPTKLFPDNSMSLERNYHFSNYFEELGEKPLFSFSDNVFRVFYSNYGTIGVIRFDKNEAILKEIHSGKKKQVIRKINKKEWDVVMQIFRKTKKLRDSVTTLDGDSSWFFESKLEESYNILFADNLSGEIGDIYKRLESFIENGPHRSMQK